jgi:hypothetical protein
MSSGFNAGNFARRNNKDLMRAARVFPIASEPLALGKAALYTSKTHRVSTTITAMATNAVASVVVQNLAVFKKPGKRGATSSASIYSIIAAPAATGKTTALDDYIPVIEAHDEKSNAWFQMAMQKYQHAYVDWKDDRAELRKAIKKRRKNGESSRDIEDELDEHDKRKPVEPVEDRLLYSDITTRRLIDQLKGTGRSAALVSDDAQVVLDHLPRLFAHLNRGFDGSTITLDRADGETILAYKPRLTTLLMLQNDVLDQFEASYGSKARSIGFWARNLFGTAYKIVDERYLDDVVVNADDLDALRDLLNELLAEIERRKRDGITTLDEIELDDQALVCWNDFATEMRRRMNGAGDIRDVGDLVDISDFASRCAEHAGRLATIWTVLLKEKKISLTTIQAAIEVIRFHLAEFQDRYSLLHRVPDVVMQAYDLDAYLKRLWHDGMRSVSKSFIERNAKEDLRDVTNLDAALKLLQSMYRVQIMPGPGRGRRIVHFPQPAIPFVYTCD